MTRKTSNEPETKFFSIDEATKTLPLVKAIVADIVTNYKSIRDSMEVREEKPGDRDLGDRIEAMKDELMSNVDELRHLGIELKSFEIGLVDFPHMKDGKEICLCWKLGEDKIAWWHDKESGLSGRQPLTL